MLPEDDISFIFFRADVNAAGDFELTFISIIFESIVCKSINSKHIGFPEALDLHP